MASRLELHEELCTLLGSENVYFQPPESEKLSYDAIVYKLEDITSRHANNKNYTNRKRYEVMLITRKADNDLIDSILEHFPYSIFNRYYIVEYLHHHVFYIYY